MTTQTMRKPKPGQWNEKEYIAYLETKTVLLQDEIDNLKAVASILLVRLSCNKNPHWAWQRLSELCKNKSGRVLQLIRTQYGSD